MRFPISLLPFLLAVSASAQPVLLLSDEPGAWPKIFGSVGIPANQATDLPVAALSKQVEAGAFAVLEGHSDYSAAVGVRQSSKRVAVRSIIDEHQPKLPIIWERTLELPVSELPASAKIFARERWTGAPMLAGWKHGKGAVLWLAAKPGPKGYERFPYLLQAATDLGLTAPLRSNRLWAFFDSSYRLRVDLDYFAEKWRKAGISALQVAGWHYNESDTERDSYLRKLIEACHKRNILVYVWLELPHVSEKFWQDHPEWREKTGIGQDAHLDWRKLMNLQNRECFRAVTGSVRSLIERFDWDGVNLAELYFESLEGIANPARFTPMNDDVRTEYQALTGIDPKTLFAADASKDAIAAFLQYRAELARRMQSEWMKEVEGMRRSRPDLDLVLTHVDDRYDTRMRDLIGADASRVLPMLEQHDFTFLIEDPATIWHLGPDRYPQIAEKYAPLTPRKDKLAIDINIVSRYQDVYPTKQQTGTELFQLVHLAAGAFPRVALYFENSILNADYPLLPASAAVFTRHETVGPKTVVETPQGVGVVWKGEALVDGKLWPVLDGSMVWLPAGAHVIEAAQRSAPVRLVDFNGELRTARVLPAGVEFSYQSSARALARLDKKPVKVEVDGEVVHLPTVGENVIVLPRGQHFVTISVEEPTKLTSAAR